MVGPRGELSKDLCSLIVKVATAVETKNWAELHKDSSSLSRTKYLRVFQKKIALSGFREQAAWMCGRFEQARMQKAGGSGPSRRAKAQARRSRRAKREYFDTHTDWGRG